MSQDEEDPTQHLVKTLLDSAERIKNAAEAIKKVDANVARLTEKILAASPDRIVAAATNSLAESGEEVGRKLQTILRRELASAEYTRQEAKVESRRWRLVVSCLAIAILGFSGGVFATLMIQQYRG
jgi:phage shock protein A